MGDGLRGGGGGMLWEHSGLSSANRKLMGACKLKWDSIAPMPNGWTTRPEAAELTDKIRQTVLDNFPPGDIAIKDPRMCRVLPAYTRALHDYEIVYLRIVRSQEEVALSLQARNNFSLEKGRALWQVYEDDADFHTRGGNVIRIRYADLLRDWREELSFFSWTEEQAKAVDKHLDPRKRHHKVEEEPDARRCATYRL
jgi:hypothetical protein